MTMSQANFDPFAISGFTSYDKLLECGRKMRLDKEQQFDTGTDGGTEETSIGSLLHEMLAAHYMGHDPLTMELGGNHDLVVNMEATRLYKGYLEYYPRDEFSDVAFVEYKIEKGDSDVERAVGISPFSGIIDLGINLSAQDCATLEQTSRLELEPGFYLADHKTSKTGGGRLIDMQSNNLQFTAYMLAFAAKYPDVPLKGFIANLVVKTKTPQYHRLFIPPPSHIEISALRNMWAEVELRRRTNIDFANAKACFLYRTCDHFLAGRCLRY